MFDLRDPDGPRDGWSRRYSYVLEACEEAERLGADSVWFTEHHGFDDGYLPQPLVFAAAVAARTRRVRIGTAVVVAPFRHPRHLAEEAAVVDLLSSGRLELGLGAGNRFAEFDMFGATWESRTNAAAACAEQVRAASLDPTVTPRPVQQPIPIWMGYGGPRGARLAGELGAGLLSLDRRLLEPYARAYVGDGEPRMSGLVSAYASADPDREWARVGQLHADQWNSYLRHARDGTELPASPPTDPQRARTRGLRPSGLGFGTAEEMAGMIVDHVREIPVDTILLWAGLPGQDEAEMSAHIRLTLDELAPLVRTGPGRSAASAGCE